MGWSDTKIRKAFALIAAVLWVVWVAMWLKGWQGARPASGWYLAVMAVVVLWGLWEAFWKVRPNA